MFHNFLQINLVLDEQSYLDIHGIQIFFKSLVVANALGDLQKVSWDILRNIFNSTLCFQIDWPLMVML